MRKAGPNQSKLSFFFEGNFTCPVCKRKFATSGGLFNHMRSHKLPIDVSSSTFQNETEIKIKLPKTYYEMFEKIASRDGLNSSDAIRFLICSLFQLEAENNVFRIPKPINITKMVS